ncbi:MAG: insulinase family protein [Clostridia bacterium]|nr:insulinase family protein [Clostridia bacterium]
MLENSVALGNQAQGFFIKNDRFKTTYISYNFYLPLDKNSVASFALLPFILTTCSKDYPDFSRLNFKLNKLYSASLSASAEKVGDYQLLKVAISVIDDKYALDGENLVNKAVELLNHLIFEPRVENCAFFNSDVEREKRKAIEHIRGEMAEKRIYARRRLVEEMYKNDVYGISKCGTVEQIEKVTPEGLYAAWRDLIESATIVVNVISKTLPLNTFDNIKSYLSAFDRSSAKSVLDSKPTRSICAARRVEEHLDISQGKLVMGFSVDKADDKNNAALTVMCDIFGGGPYSRLFSNVREKMSLCYYCSATIEKRKGLLIVDSGVEASNAKRAEAEILRQLEVIKSGSFSDFEFESSKKAIINLLNGYGDHQEAIDAWYTIKSSSNIQISPEDFVLAVARVDKQAVTNAAKSVKLHTVYNLSPNVSEEGE